MCCKSVVAASETFLRKPGMTGSAEPGHTVLTEESEIIIDIPAD
jgi:hypothetical protein